ncbi:MAG TPA: GAF domain-containing protein [Candidatus Xenobia bacterium]|jgi:GAF domain-containing protein
MSVESEGPTIQVGLQELLEQAVALVSAQRGLIAVCVPDSDAMRIDAAFGLDRETAWTTGQISQSLLRRAVTQKRGILTHDALEDKRFSETTSVILSGLRSAICEPVFVHEAVWGVVYVDNVIQSGAFRQSDLKKLKEFSARVSQYIEKQV